MRWIRYSLGAAVVAGAVIVGSTLDGYGQTDANYVQIVTDSSFRYIRSNGIPDHPTGAFPNPHNPNRISAQRYMFRIPLNPQVAAVAERRPEYLRGVALNGVPFDPGTGEFWNRDFRWNYEALTGAINLGVDANKAHVQPTGAYHYHGTPEGVMQRLNRGQGMTMVGYAADGFPIYARYGLSNPMQLNSGTRTMRASYRIKSGTRPDGPGGTFDGSFVRDWEYVPGLGDLDECKRRYGVTPEYPNGTYHYFVTDQYPFVHRILKGTPDQTFAKQRPHGPPHMHHGPPPRF